jgi:replicative DNA helicase
VSEARIPPNNLGAERAILGSALLDGACLDACSGLRAEDFYSEANGTIYAAMRALQSKGTPIDSISLRDHLVAAKALDAVGGDEYTLSLTNTIPSVANVAAYAASVRERASVRRVIAAAHQIASQGYSDSADAAAYLATAEATLLAATESMRASRAVTMEHVAGEVLVQLGTPEKRDQRRPSGLEFLDRIMRGGARPGRLLVAAGRPGMGKTAFGLQWAMATARKTGLPVLFHTCEMPSLELGERAAAATAGVDLASIGAGELEGRDMNAVVNALGELAMLPIVIDDTPAVTLAQVRGNANRIKRKHGRLGMIVVDYLGLMSMPSTGSRSERQDQQIGAVTRELKRMAKELEVPVLLLAQLNRESEREGGRPRMSQLRGSGEIEQDADVIMLLHHVVENGEPVEGLRELIVEKQRGGATGIGRIAWTKEFTRFASLADE